MHRVLLAVILAAALAAVAGAPAAQAAGIRRQPDRTWQTNRGVRAIAVDPRTGVVYVGGVFDAVRPARACPTCASVSRHHLAAFDRHGDLLPWNPGADGPVLALAFSARNRSVIAGGEFHRAGGRSRAHLASFAARGGGALGRWRPNPDGPVRALAVSRGSLYVGGHFGRIGGRRRANVAAFDLRRGRRPRLLRRFRPHVDHEVLAIATAHERVFLGGALRHVNGRSQRHLTALTRRGRVLRFALHPRFRVHALVASPTGVYVAEGGPRGGFVLARGVRRGRARWRIRLDGDAQALALMRGRLYVGGHFPNVCGGRGRGHGVPFVCDRPIRRRKLCSVVMRQADASPRRAARGVSAWNPNANSTLGVFALASWRGRLLVGGDFTRIGGRAQQGFASFH